MIGRVRGSVGTAESYCAVCNVNLQTIVVRALKHVAEYNIAAINNNLASCQALVLVDD